MTTNLELILTGVLITETLLVAVFAVLAWAYVKGLELELGDEKLARTKAEVRLRVVERDTSRGLQAVGHFLRARPNIPYPGPILVEDSYRYKNSGRNAGQSV